MKINLLLSVAFLACGLICFFPPSGAAYDPAASAVVTKLPTDIRCGTTAVTGVDLTKAIAFSTAMPSTSYQIFFQQNGLVTTLTTSSVATSGFTLNLSLGVTGNISWIAIANK